MFLFHGKFSEHSIIFLKPHAGFNTKTNMQATQNLIGTRKSYFCLLLHKNLGDKKQRIDVQKQQRAFNDILIKFYEFEVHKTNVWKNQSLFSKKASLDNN